MPNARPAAGHRDLRRLPAIRVVLHAIRNAFTVPRSLPEGEAAGA